MTTLPTFELCSASLSSSQANVSLSSKELQQFRRYGTLGKVITFRCMYRDVSAGIGPRVGQHPGDSQSRFYHTDPRLMSPTVIAELANVNCKQS